MNRINQVFFYCIINRSDSRNNFFFSIIKVSDNFEAKLHEYLFTCNGTKCLSYNPALRPIKNASKILLVNIRIGIKRIFEMDEANHKMTLFAVVFKVKT